MDLAGILKLAHALSGVAFIAGLIGFWVVLGVASRTDSLATMRLMLRVARPFDRLVTGGGTSLAILGIATAIALGRPIFGPLQGGRWDWLAVSTLLMLPLFAFIAVVYPRFSRTLRAALQDAEDQPVPTVTLAVQRAWADPVYRAARSYELIAVLIVFGLMVAKPF